MATTETSGVMGYADANGDVHIHYPVTKAELVDGLDDPENLPVMPTSRGGTGASTAAAALTNLGAYDKTTVDGLINALRAELVSGQVSAPLETDGGLALLTDDGEEICAERMLVSADTVTALAAAVDTLGVNLANAIVTD